MKQKQLRLICAQCAGCGWLCEEHPTLPWGHDDECEGVGVACRCNETAVAPHAEVFIEDDAIDAGVPLR